MVRVAGNGLGGPRRRERKTVLFVLAHQDDECFCGTRIGREVDFGHRVICSYLTDGAARVAASVRERESLGALETLGVTAEQVLFLGAREGVPDGELVEHLEATYRSLHEALGSRPIHRIYCLAYEGGHADHDASHLIAVRLAVVRGIARRTWQIPVYNGFRTRGRRFRVLAPLPRLTRRCERRLGLGEALRHTALAFRYPSQWRSFAGLLPGLAVQRLLHRREVFQAVDVRALAQPPHPGAPLYERLHGFAAARFRDAAAPFVTALMAELDGRVRPLP